LDKLKNWGNYVFLPEKLLGGADVLCRMDLAFGIRKIREEAKRWVSLSRCECPYLMGGGFVTLADNRFGTASYKILGGLASGAFRA
jgi:hypothetical protein